MAVQFNLLPDIKLEFDKQQRTKRFVYIVAALSCTVIIAIFVVSFISVNVLQKKLLSDAGGDIDKYSNQLKDIPNLDKILTIQNQLNALPDLHQNKHYTSRLLVFLPEITPANAYIGKLNMDTTTNTIAITGTADNVEAVNTYVDALKFTQYQVPGTIDEDDCGKASGTWNDKNNICTKSAFTSVVLTKVDRNEKQATYTVTFNYDPALFTGPTSVGLIVKKEVTTRSVINAPDANGQLNTQQLFNGQTGKPTTPTSQQGGQ